METETSKKFLIYTVQVNFQKNDRAQFILLEDVEKLALYTLEQLEAANAISNMQMWSAHFRK